MLHQTDWKGENILVTGGAGFIGSHLILALLEKGARVFVVDLCKTPWRLKLILDKIHYIQSDIVHWDGVIPGEKVEYVFHLAAFSNPTQAQKEPESAYRQNVRGMANILEVARKHKAKRFIFISGGALYTNIPAYLPIDEKHPIDPAQNVYSMTKRLGELLCEDYIKTYSLSCAYIRLFNTYGPHQDKNYVIPSFIADALQGKDIHVYNEKIIRDFNYVEDVVGALIKLAESDFIGGPMNIGTGNGRSMGEVAQIIAQFFKLKVNNLNKEAFGAQEQICDNSLAKHHLQWQPSCSLEVGLERTIQSYLEEKK